MNPDRCPTCGRPMSDPANRFSTGQVPTGTREADDVPDPDGQEGYEVITRLARGEEPADIANAMALTLHQVESLIPHVHKAVNQRGPVRL